MQTTTQQPSRTISRLYELEVGEFTKVTREEDVEDMEYHIRPQLKHAITRDGHVYIGVNEDSYTGNLGWLYGIYTDDFDDYEYVHFQPTTTTSSYHNCQDNAVNVGFTSRKMVCKVCDKDTE